MHGSRISGLIKYILPVYALTLTTLVILAATVGPLQNTFQLWTQARVAQAKYRASERDRQHLAAERTRLLAALQDLRTNWSALQETIRVLRAAVDDPEIEQRLIEANRLTAKLSDERAVLIAKLQALRQQIEAHPDAAPGKNPAPTGAAPSP